MAKKKEIAFGAFHLPTMEKGQHTFTLTQTISRPAAEKDQGEQIVQTPYVSTINLFVAGERYALPPKEIHTVFPPAASLGDYSNVLPHIVLRRGTLPWERHAQSDQKKVPWLALLVFQDGELLPNDSEHKDQASHGFAFSLSEIRNKDSLNTAIKGHDELAGAITVNAWNDFDEEPGETPKDRASLIFTTRKTLLNQLPTPINTLAISAHTRIGQGEEEGTEKAVIMAHRLPEPQANAVVHLVSLENRYLNGNFNFGENPDDNDVVALISLKSWTFSCLSSRHNFRGLMLHLNHTHLFNMDAAPALTQQLNDDQVPQAIKDQLQKLGAGTKSLKVIDKSRRVIKGNQSVYPFSDGNKLYDQAGAFLYSLHKKLSDENKILEKAQAIIPDLGINARLLKYPAPRYWWLQSTEANGAQHNYVLGLEGSQLYAVKLSRDVAPNLRLPTTGNDDADNFLEHGMLPLPHYFRQGSQSVSWYRGPLSPVAIEDIIPGIEDIRASDQLLRYHQNVGMFETSYAAAWELGRLLTLRQKAISLKLDRWKRAYHRAQKKQEQHNKATHLPYGKVQAQQQSENRDAIEKWLLDLIKLSPVPYNYLVPDERLLPVETIRFFHIDRRWLAGLLLGAYSLGWPVDVPPQDHLLTPAFAQLQQERTGFLLRSSIVTGWPDLIIKGWDKKGKPLDLEVRKQISKNTLLCTFVGNLNKVQFSIKPEAMHFGFHQNELNGPYLKNLRGPDGQETTESPIDLSDKIDVEKVPKPIFNPNNRTVDLNRLFVAIQQKNNARKATEKFLEFDAGEFGMSLIESPVSFIWEKKN